jgi:hypothetical protein
LSSTYFFVSVQHTVENHIHWDSAAKQSTVFQNKALQLHQGQALQQVMLDYGTQILGAVQKTLTSG